MVWILTVSFQEWDGGSHCFETITISCNGKKTEAQVTDLVRARISFVYEVCLPFILDDVSVHHALRVP